MEEKIKIMFVCTGNICRSAMAEYILKHKVKNDEQLKDIVEVYSCGVYAEDGDMPTYNAIEVMEENGIDMKNHKATNVKNAKIEEMDLILCATKSHKNALIYLYPNLQNKIYTMKEYVDYDKYDIDVKDPWGYDIETYRFCEAELEKCIDLLVEKIKEVNK